MTEQAFSGTSAAKPSPENHGDVKTNGWKATRIFSLMHVSVKQIPFLERDFSGAVQNSANDLQSCARYSSSALMASKSLPAKQLVALKIPECDTLFLWATGRSRE
jgi:hypothetical protein